MISTDYKKPISQYLDEVKKTGKNLKSIHQGALNDPFFRYLEDHPIQDVEEITPLEKDVMQAILLNGSLPPNCITTSITKLIEGIYHRFPKNGDNDPPPLYFWTDTCIRHLTLEELSVVGVKVHLIGLSRNPTIFSLAYFAHIISSFRLLDRFPEIFEESGMHLNQILRAEGVPENLTLYWMKRWRFVLADILGFLNLGPGTLGVFEYIRSSRQKGLFQISDFYYNNGNLPDLLRILLAQEVLEENFYENLPVPNEFQLGDQKYPSSIVMRSIEIIAEEIYSMRFESLQNKSLPEIRQWNKQDDKKVESLSHLYQVRNNLDASFPVENILAAALLTSRIQKIHHDKILQKMIHYLAIAKNEEG